MLKRASIERKVKRPKGWRSKKSVSWLQPEQAFALFAAADARPEFGLFLRLLCYTGMRLSEALNVKVGAVDIGQANAYKRARAERGKIRGGKSQWGGPSRTRGGVPVQRETGF